MSPPIPPALLSIVGDDPRFRDLLDRVDQTWKRVATGPLPTAAVAHQYVLAVHAVSEVMLDNLGTQQKVERNKLPAPAMVVPAATVAPIVVKTQYPWQAVVGAALENASTYAELTGVAGAAERLRVVWAKEASPVRVVMAPHHSAAILQALSGELSYNYEPPLDTVQRVFEPRSDEELGSWLGVSRTTVHDWRTERFSPRAGNEKRLETVAAIARLIDEYIHPEDRQRYLRDTALPAFNGRTLDTVLASEEPEVSQSLNRVLDLLRDALVQ
jgi:hypothetical protein